MAGRTKRFARTGDVGHDLAVDFSRTKACVMHAGMAGFLYINLEGRQPTGIVAPADYESLRDELKERFLGRECQRRDPQGNVIQLFAEVHRPEELYGCSREDQPWLPDLLLTPHESLAAVRKIRGRRAVRWLGYRRLEGTHRPDGVLIATGSGIAQGPRTAAHIVDCAPTILALLGLPIPEDMEGRVISELFIRRGEETKKRRKAETSKRRNVETSKRQDVSGESTEEATSEAYSAEELAKVTERLADLGYLE